MFRTEASTGQKTAVKIRSSEHAPFWASVIITTSPKKAYQPFIVHQGAAGTFRDNLRAVGDEVNEDGPPGVKGYFKRVLPTTFGIATSPSGYLSPQIMMMYARHLVAQLPRGRKGFILFLDGYGAHFSDEALEFLHENGVYPCFLRAQNSEMDSPNDNGPNANFKSHYNQELANWRAEFADRNVMKFKPRHFNEVFWRAWEKFTDGTNQQCFMRAAWTDILIMCTHARSTNMTPLNGNRHF